MDLTTKYLGLTLKNPIVVGSCGLTSSVSEIKKLEKQGAAAVVLKSIFEEEILMDVENQLREARENGFIYDKYSETLDYIDVHVKEDHLDEYIQLIKAAKKEVLIPIIASINCVSSSVWTHFASHIEEAGADGLELNISLNPSDLVTRDFEQSIKVIIHKVLAQVTVPVTIKLNNSFTHMAKTILDLSQTGISGLVLFNRAYMPDIDINTMEAVQGKSFSSPNDFVESMRWIALLSDKVNCSLAAAKGIHTHEAIIKQILAGADAVQIVSVLYENGIESINGLLSGLEKWMQEKGFSSLEKFKGKASSKNVGNPAVFERIQFMKYFSGIH
ncbi:MAG: dihydroorotate dehydrogenase-like protein [Deltaproteobacteria bacterium]|nr:dihydroorotate dehydrogenase-like protein [Deltaproteobacteria bacterium]